MFPMAAQNKGIELNKKNTISYVAADSIHKQLDEQAKSIR